VVKRFHFAKAGLVCLAVVVALGSLGVAYGYSSGALGAGDMMAMACVSGPFTWVVSNDDGKVTSLCPYGVIDCGDDGGGTNCDTWGGLSSDDPSEPQTIGVCCARYDKDVARTTARVSCDRGEITVLIENAYPSYYPTVFFGLKNTECFSVRVKSIDISCAIPELTITLTGITQDQVICAGKEVVGGLAIHTEQCAHQDSCYYVKIKIVLVQKEESGCGWGWGGCWNPCGWDWGGCWNPCGWGGCWGWCGCKGWW
jgi:hypothetical protein